MILSLKGTYFQSHIKSGTALHSRGRTSEELNFGRGCTIRQKMVTVQESFNTSPYDVFILFYFLRH